MTTVKDTVNEWKLQHTLEDMQYGQIVTITARWILVMAGVLLVLWNPEPLGQMRFQILVLLLLAVANFNLHAQLLRKRPAKALIWYAASVGDLIVITTLVATTGGFDSNIFTFFFPAVLALSVAFSTAITFLFTGSLMAVYFMIGMATLPDSGDFQILLVRLLMIAAVAMSGNLYWRLEGQRRHEAEQTQAELKSQIEKRRKA